MTQLIDTPVNNQSPQVILVVDDAPQTVHMLCEALTNAGYIAMAALSADQATALLKITVPDGVLLDAVMPETDGFTFCQQLKNDPLLAHVPVVFMTGLSETDQILKGFASGGVDYVIKPLNIPEVLARLATHVGNARVTRLVREAVDVAGMGTLLLDTLGRVAWRSPQAEVWLQQAFNQPGQEGVYKQWLTEVAKGGTIAVAIAPNQRLMGRNLGASGLGERMLLLTLAPSDEVATRRVHDIKLTPRETEVLSWLAKGKTNRDIGDILEMSPRTVSKHLEHVFEKLGVETRTAAAGVASSLNL
jgi:DNA-binding response OmpR family regulator/DNA-binding CsgD family transcriptional regulator